MEAIRTVRLTKKYKEVTAVNELDMSVERGELFALLGVNGAGKTTAIRLLSCLSKPTEGDAFICGKSIAEQPTEVKRLIAVSPQETAVAAKLTARENLMLMARLYGLGSVEARARTDKLSESLGLGEVMERKAGKLSGGWQRRLSIAMALVGEPEILFLDEPTLGLDVIARSELWELIRKLKGKSTVLLTTHYMEEAEALSDRIGIMRSGKLLTVGTADELKKATGAERFEEAFIKIVREGKL